MRNTATDYEFKWKLNLGFKSGLGEIKQRG
jgi:hypothetical protein